VARRHKRAWVECEGRDGVACAARVAQPGGDVEAAGVEDAHRALLRARGVSSREAGAAVALRPKRTRLAARGDGGGALRRLNAQQVALVAPFNAPAQLHMESRRVVAWH
jgi:hypothetical protein